MNKEITNIDEKEKMAHFLVELNTLTIKHGLYISTILDENGLTRDFPYLIPTDENVRYSAYELNYDSGEIVFIQV